MTNIKSLIRLLGLALFVSTALACSDSTGPESTSILVRNRASLSVDFLYISDCSAAFWGNDRLGASEVILPGRDRSFAVDPGCWDVQAEFSNGFVAEEFAIELSRGRTYELTLTN